MASTGTNRLVIKHQDGFGGNFVDSQYLGAAYDIKAPYIFERMMMKIYSSKNQFFTQKHLIGMLGSQGIGSMEIDSEIFRWYLEGAHEKLATSLGPVNPAITAPGLNNTTFQIELDLDYYHRPDVLMGEDSRYPLEIVEGPIPNGTGNVYTVRIQGDNPSDFLPVDQLDAGKQFSKVWTSVESEGNDVFGTQQVPASFQLESQLGAFAQSIEVTDKALRTQGRISLDWEHTNKITGKTSKVSQFIPYYEALMHEELTYSSFTVKMV